jgi:anti-sigma-K factor RskA
MTGEHERYEQLAVGHVLGGLEAADAADFRTHLLGCRDCRLRVAELRDIAADLAAAERDERAQAKVQTEVARRVEDDDGPDGPDPAPQRIGVRHVTVATIVVLVLAGAMAFWNLHLRTASTTYARVAEYRGETLRELATGIPVEVELAEGVEGLVVVDGEQVAFTLDGLPPLRDDERLVVWLLGAEEGPVAALRIHALQLGAGVLAGHVDAEDAEELVITRQRGPVTEAPAGDRIVRADLQRGQATS